MPTLFDPLQIGDITLSNRIIMAPLTRQRAEEIRVPNALMAKYYAERATAGLIISEATSVTPQGVGYADTPGIWSQEQVEGWKKVVEAVHGRGAAVLERQRRHPHPRVVGHQCDKRVDVMCRERFEEAVEQLAFLRPTRCGRGRAE